MCGDCFVCIYLVCQCDGLELGRRNRRITVRESRLGLTVGGPDMLGRGHHGSHCTRTLAANTDNDIGIAKGQPVDVEIMMGVAFGHTQTVGQYGCPCQFQFLGLLHSQYLRACAQGRHSICH